MCLLSLSILGGCASLSDSLFLLKKLDDQGKSKALTEKGIELYKENLVKAENYDMIDEVRKHFEVALRYDPSNKVAERYVEDLDTLVQTRVTEKVALARSLSNKSNRTDDENFRLCSTVEQASRLNPTSAEVVKLKEETGPVCASLVASYAEKGKSLNDSVKESDSNEKKEQVYSQAIEYYHRILLIDPGNNAARSEEKTLQENLLPLFHQKESAVEQKIAKGQFDQAKKDLASLRSFNEKLGNRFEKDVRELTYRLYYEWARRTFTQKKYDEADDLVEKALALDRTSEALNLRREILAQKRKIEDGADFEAFLGYVDSLIDQMRLGDAHRKVASALAKTADQGRKQHLQQRETRIRALLADLYKQAVDSYKQESFQKAVQLFEIIVDVDPGFEQASSYLEKARAKQQLLETI